MRTAMYSRKRETAQELAGKYGVDTIYTDLGTLFSDTNVNTRIYCFTKQHALRTGLSGTSTWQTCRLRKTVHVHASGSRNADCTCTRKANCCCLKPSPTFICPIKVIQEQLPSWSIKLIQCNYSQYSRKDNDLLAGKRRTYSIHISLVAR